MVPITASGAYPAVSPRCLILWAQKNEKEAFQLGLSPALYCSVPKIVFRWENHCACVCTSMNVSACMIVVGVQLSVGKGQYLHVNYIAMLIAEHMPEESGASLHY